MTLGWDSVLSALHVAGVALFVAFVAWLAFRHRFTVFNFDEWRMVAWLLTTPFGEWLVTPHNSHMIPGTLLVFAADFFWGARGLLLVGVSLVCTGLAAWFLLRALRTGGGLPAPLSRSVGALLVFAVFWSAIFHSLLWPAALWNTSALLFFTLAVWQMGVFIQQRREAADASLRPLVRASLFALAATFSFGTGFATWGSLLVMALLARLPLRITASLAGASFAGTFSFLVVSGINRRPRPRAEDAEPITLGFPPVGDILSFDASFVGGVLAHTASGLLGWNEDRVLEFAVSAGTVGLAALLAFALFLLVRPARATPLALLALALGVFPAMAGLAAGLARVAMGAEQSISLRYAIWSVLFWMGVLCAAASLIPRANARRGAFRLLVIAPILVSLCMLPAFSDAMRAQQERDRLLSAGSLALLLGVRSELIARKLSGGRFDLVLESMDTLAAERRGFFDDPRVDWIDQPIRAVGGPAPSSLCSGRIGRVGRLESRSGTALRVRGRAWDHGASAPPASIVIVDATGTVRGLGNREPDWWDTLAGRREAGLSPGSPWTGVVPRYAPGQSHVAYAVLSDGRLCRVNAFEAPR